MFPWIILDRDGVINVDRKDYVKNLDEWQAIPGSIEAIAALSRNGYNIAVATNQAGIGRKRYTIESLETLHKHLRCEVERRGGMIHGIFYCPHKPEDGCACRKPKAGLLDEIENQFGISVKGVPFVGDAERDLQAALTKGCEPVLVRTGKGRATSKLLTTHPAYRNIPVYDDLTSYAKTLLR